GRTNLGRVRPDRQQSLQAAGRAIAARTNRDEGRRLRLFLLKEVVRTHVPAPSAAILRREIARKHPFRPADSSIPPEGVSEPSGLAVIRFAWRGRNGEKLCDVVNFS